MNIPKATEYIRLARGMLDAAPQNSDGNVTVNRYPVRVALAVALSELEEENNEGTSD